MKIKKLSDQCIRNVELIKEAKEYIEGHSAAYCAIQSIVHPIEQVVFANTNMRGHDRWVRYWFNRLEKLERAQRGLAKQIFKLVGCLSYEYNGHRFQVKNLSYYRTFFLGIRVRIEKYDVIVT